MSNNGKDTVREKLLKMSTKEELLWPLIVAGIFLFISI